MKSLYKIFKEQFHSNELWRRAWEFSRFKRFDNLQEYKKRVSRKITKEDVPALIVTLFIAVLVIVILSHVFEDSDLTYAISGFMTLFVVVQRLGEKFLKKQDE